MTRLLAPACRSARQKMRGRFKPEVGIGIQWQAFPDAASLGQMFPPYRRTFLFAGEFIDAAHEAIAAMPVEGALIRGAVAGFLRPADALAVYEHAYFSPGDVLEFGSAWGLSTTILCEAARSTGRGVRVHSVEIRPDFQQATAQAVRSAGLTRYYRGLPGDADDVADELIAQGRNYGFVFLDHDHTYQATKRMCGRLRSLLRPGGTAVFHDFNDQRNITEPEQYGIYHAIAEMLDDPGIVFIGVTGCCAVLHRPRS